MRSGQAQLLEAAPGQRLSHGLEDGVVLGGGPECAGADEDTVAAKHVAQRLHACHAHGAHPLPQQVAALERGER